jgi:HAD superfamily hydrolase (TIGR01450 family)
MLDLARFRAVLFDLDGTLCHQDHPLPGAAELVAHLQDTNMPLACLSNSTSSSQAVSVRLAKMGMKVSPDQIYTAADEAAAVVFERYGPRPRVFHLATRGMVDLLEGNVDWAAEPGDPCDVVVNGAPADHHATPIRQRIALELLRGGADLISVCGDRAYTSRRGIEIGCGALGTMLSYASGRPVHYCGKPQPHFFQAILARLGVRPEEAVLVGDNLESDVAGAKRVGIKTILTLTGVVRKSDLSELPETQTPDWVVNDLLELLA